MSKKKDTGTAFLVEIRSEPQWRQLCRKEGLVVVDVYSGWAGSCASVVPFMKKIKQEIVERHDSFSNKITFASACADKLEDLLVFRDHAEPTFLFLAGGGKPVKIFKGCHVPNLANAIYDEFDRELLVVEGKARRNVISIDDDETRMRKFEAEAKRLADMLKDDDEPAEPPIVRRESSVLLETIMSAYTIAVIQPFLREQIDEIKEFLAADFHVLGQSTIKIDDYEARKLYRIPFEVEDSDTRKSTDGNMPGPDPGKPKKKVAVVLPNGVLGETTFLLLECTEIKNIIESGGTPSGALQTADDWLRLKVGPRIYEQAVEHSPNSLHASYGKGQYLSGVWCPRRYDDKRHILLTYFPEFLVEKILPYEVGEQYVPKRYQVFVFPGAKAKEIQSVLKNFEFDVFAQGVLKLNAAKVSAILKSSGLAEQEADALKKKLSEGNWLCASINCRNSNFVDTLQSTSPPPVYVSVDPVHGANETAILFPNLNAKYEEDAEEVMQKYLGRSKKRVPDEVVESDALDLPPMELQFDDEPTGPPSAQSANVSRLSTDGAKPKP